MIYLILRETRLQRIKLVSIHSLTDDFHKTFNFFQFNIAPFLILHNCLIKHKIFCVFAHI